MVAINSKTYNRAPRQFPGSVRVERLEINGVDVSDNYEQIDIFESVFTSTMSGRIVLVDTTNLIKRIPIIGEENVEIVLTDEVETHEYKFKCYKLTDRKNPRTGVLRYVLHLCSEEFWLDAMQRVSKSYNLKLLEDNVKDVLQSQDWLGSSKDLIVGDTKEPVCVVVPGWSPLFAATWMANRAQSGDDKYKGDFLFYETHSGFKWVAVDNLFDSAENQTYGVLSYDPMRPTQEGRTRYDSRNADDTMRLEGWDVVTTFDAIENAKLGMHANQTRVLDLIERDFEDFTFDYLQSFYDHEHLDGVSGINAKPLTSFQHPGHEHPEANLRVVVKHKGLFDDEPDGNGNSAHLIPPKISQRQQMENFKLRCHLPGHLGIEAGMIVEFFFPNPELISLNDSPGIDPAYSGEYMITGLRRKIQRDKFDIHFDMIKDSRGVDASKAFD